MAVGGVPNAKEYGQHRYYNTIIMGPIYYNPGRVEWRDFGSIANFQRITRIHEFLHWETTLGSHVRIANLFNLRSRGYQYGEDEDAASRALDDWLKNGCQNKKK